MSCAIVSSHARITHCSLARRMIFVPEAFLHNNESLDVLSRGRHLVQITKPLLLRYCSSPREYVRKEMKLFPRARHRSLACLRVPTHPAIFPFQRSALNEAAVMCDNIPLYVNTDRLATIQVNLHYKLPSSTVHSSYLDSSKYIENFIFGNHIFVLRMFDVSLLLLAF